MRNIKFSMEDDFKIEEGSISCPMLVVQVKNIPDEGMELQGDIPLQNLDLRDDDRFIFGDALLSFRLHISVARHDVLVKGSLSATIQAICDRCVETAPLEIRCDEVFHRYKNEAEQPVDLTEDIREDILLALPQVFLCKEDCLGLCPKCGQNLNLGTCDCTDDEEPFEEEDEKQDPWAAFDNLKLDK